MPQSLTSSIEASRTADGISSRNALRTLVVGTGIAWAILFAPIALRYQLQMYADGSIFSYAVAVQDSWAFHFHNISGRAFTYIAAMLPAELYVRITRNPAGGIVLYGFLFYVAQSVGLLVTWLADRTRGRIVFAFTCASTAILCPVVFGMPTELWMSHALFWPTLAVCLHERGGFGKAALIFVLMTMLLLTHEGAVIFAVVMLAALALRGIRDDAFRRAVLAFIPALAIWVAMKLTFPPDDYIADVLFQHAFYLIDVRQLFEHAVFLVALAALAGYGVLFLALRRRLPAKAHVLAAAVVGIGLAIYWLRFDHSLHTQGRYHLRTLLLMGVPGFGVLAAAYAVCPEGRLKLPYFARMLNGLAHPATLQAAIGAFMLVMLIHAVETAKFVTAWTAYKDAVRTLAMGTQFDPQLGSPKFVSSQRIGADLNRLNWRSTTPYLSVIVSRYLAPNRLVVDPEANYFWLSCETATDNEQTARAGVPAATRELVRLLACLHRPAAH